MKKYAKIIDEETKLCEVGLGDTEAIYYEEIISDENGDKKIIHKVKEYYQKIGYEIKDVEEGYDGNWYVLGYAPAKPEPTEDEMKENVKMIRNSYLQQTDFTQLSDAPFTVEEKAEYAEYRKYLRDYPEEENWWLQNPKTFEERKGLMNQS